MASFTRAIAPLGRHRCISVASICTIFFALIQLSPSFAPPTAHAFSHQNVGVAGGRSSLIGVLSSSFPTLEQGVAQIRLPSNLHSKSRKYDVGLTALPDSADEDVPTENVSTNKPSTLQQDIQSIATLVGAQALLIVISAVLAKLLNIPNLGLGLGFACSSNAIVQGLQWTVPLFATAGIMKVVEPYSPALQGVTEATQRSVLAVMGKRRRPLYALLVSLLLGAVAGIGEEWLFRGLFQTALTAKFSGGVALAISGIVFGLLHAVTPLYAFLAGAASVFFGYLYNTTGNLAVPMICHAVYDVGALMWAHWGVTALSSQEQDKILQSGPGSPILDASTLKE